MKLSTKEILQDGLMCEKQIIEMYTKAILEASNKPLIDLLMKHQSELIATQHAIFMEMEKNGMYPVTPAKEQDIQQILTTADSTKKCYKETLKK